MLLYLLATVTYFTSTLPRKCVYSYRKITPFQSVDPVMCSRRLMCRNMTVRLIHWHGTPCVRLGRLCYYRAMRTNNVVLCLCLLLLLYCVKYLKLHSVTRGYILYKKDWKLTFYSLTKRLRKIPAEIQSFRRVDYEECKTFILLYNRLSEQYLGESLKRNVILKKNISNTKQLL